MSKSHSELVSTTPTSPRVSDFHSGILECGREIRCLSLLGNCDGPLETHGQRCSLASICLGHHCELDGLQALYFLTTPLNFCSMDTATTFNTSLEPPPPSRVLLSNLTE